MRVEIFKSDIKHGDQSVCQTCVVARAINRVLPEGYISSVRGLKYDIQKVLTTSFGDFYESVKYDLPLPSEVRNYIRRFDKNKKSVLPTVFNITVPELPAL